MNSIFWPVYPIIIGGAGALCFKYPAILRKPIYYGIGCCILFALFFAVYSLSTLNAYDKTLSNVKIVKDINVNPCDTSAISFTSQRQNDKIDILESYVFSSIIVSQSFIQEVANICLNIFYILCGLLFVTYISTYINKHKGKRGNS